VKIQYWIISKVGSQSIHYSITGEGSIEEECYQDAKEKADAEIPMKGDIKIQKVGIITE